MIFAELTQVADPEPHPAALNLAIDEVLPRGAAGPLLRRYRWARPAVSFGYFGKWAEVARCWPDRDWVRRWTGGGVVPHGEDATYTLIAPFGDPLLRLSPLECYARIHEAVAAALQGADRRLDLAPVAAPKVSDACFENAARHDVLADGKKIAGAAQRRTRLGLLHQGSVQIREAGEAGLTRLAALLAERVRTRELHADELAAAEELAAGKYAREDWLKRC